MTDPTPPNGNGNETVSVVGPMGLSATARGLLTPIILIVGLGFGVTIYFTSRTASEAMSQHARIETAMARQADAMEVQNWILSLPQDKRPRLIRPLSASRFLEDDRR